MSYTSETGSLGIAIQLVKGVFTAPTDYMKVQSIDINPDGEKLVPDPEIGGVSDITDVHQGVYKLGGSIDTYVRPEAIGVLMRGALGEYVASGAVATGAYLHNFAPASGSLPWISIKKVVSDNVQTFDYTDCKVGGFTFDINASEFCSAKFDITGISDAVGVAGVPTYESAPLLVATKATINIGGVPVSVKSCSVEYKNNLDDGDFRVGSRFLGDITEKRRELDVKMDVTLDTTSELYKKAFYGAANATSAGFSVYADSVDIILESPTQIATSGIYYKMLFSIKNAVFMAAPTPASGDDLVVIPLELKATKVTGQNIIDVKIWNGKSTY
jgi:hypothetical protein